MWLAIAVGVIVFVLLMTCSPNRVRERGYRRAAKNYLAQQRAKCEAEGIPFDPEYEARKAVYGDRTTDETTS